MDPTRLLGSADAGREHAEWGHRSRSGGAEGPFGQPQHIGSLVRARRLWGSHALHFAQSHSLNPPFPRITLAHVLHCATLAYMNPRPRTHSISLRVSTEELAAIDHLAEQLDWTRSQVIRQVLAVGIRALRRTKAIDLQRLIASEILPPKPKRKRKNR